MPVSFVGVKITTFRDLNLIIEHGTGIQKAAALTEVELALDDFS